jgi:sortase A
MTVVTKVSLEPVLKWARRALLGGAILILGYCCFVEVDAWMFQRREQAQIETTASPGAFRIIAPQKKRPDGLIGRMEILRLGVSVVVVEGTGEVTLRRAAGHIEGTALPGQPGNVGIAGHRDSFFRPLKNIQRNDVIILTTSRGQFRYRVVSTKVVSPADVAVLNPDGTEVLTLVTCYPFYFIGSAPSRFIVRAARVI